MGHPKEIEELKRVTQEPYLVDYSTISEDYNSVDDHYPEDEINSIDDCIDGVEEPLYGALAIITDKNEELCRIGVTCEGPVTEIEENYSISKCTVPTSFTDSTKINRPEHNIRM